MSNCQNSKIWNRLIQTALALAFVAPAAAPGSAAALPEDQPGTCAFEARLASFEEVEGWTKVPGPKPGQTIWVSPEAALTNADVAKAWPDQMDGEYCVGLLLTEDGAIKFAHLTRAHIGEPMVLMIDGRVTAAPTIAAEITGGRAILQGEFTEEQVKAIAAGIPGR